MHLLLWMQIRFIKVYKLNCVLKAIHYQPSWVKFALEDKWLIDWKYKVLSLS